MGLIFLSYDIACQWGVNFNQRMALFPSDMQLDLALITIRLLVPKLHLMVHGEKCQAPYSFNYNIGVGRTDGEAVERFWSMTNPTTPGSKEMTPGHRHDHLNSFFGHLNWHKVCNAGKNLFWL